MKAVDFPKRPSKQLSSQTTIIVSIVVFFICLASAAIIFWCVKPIPQTLQNESTRGAISILAVVLGMLASGCIAGLFAFEYADVEPKEKGSIVFTTWLFMSAIFLLIFLSIYCLRKNGVFNMMDTWASILLFIGIFALLDGIVLLERWDATLLPRK